MRSSLPAKAGPTTLLPAPLPDVNSVATMSSFCFFVLHSVHMKARHALTSAAASVSMILRWC
jgi:hypothetical protein